MLTLTFKLNNASKSLYSIKNKYKKGYMQENI